MGILDSALSQFAGVDIAGLASRLGLSEAQVQSILGALGTVQPDPGNHIDAAAAQAAVSPDKVQQLLDAIGGQDKLDQIVGALSQGGGIESVMSGLFGKS